MRSINFRSIVAILHDLLWASVVWIGGFYFRYGLMDMAAVPFVAFETLPVVLSIQLATCMSFGLYRGMWRYASWHDLRRISMAVTVSAVVITALMFIWKPGAGVPRSLLLLNPLLLTLFMGGGRIAYRWWKTERPNAANSVNAEPVLLLTSGDLSPGFLYEIQRTPNFNLLGILTSDSGTVGRAISGVPILGTWGEVSFVAQRMGIKRAILSDKNLDHDTRRHAFKLCESAKLKLMMLPDVDDLVSGRLRYSEIREVSLDD